MIMRLITREDLPACGIVYAKAFAVPPYNGMWTPQSATDMLQGLLGRDPDHCWCIEDDGSILGFAFCTTYGDFRGTIQEFAVAPAHQGKGLGTRLMEHILREFRSEGIANADLVANLDAPAYRFYQKFGFEHPHRYTLMARSL